jgi:hypothetical protein
MKTSCAILIVITAIICAACSKGQPDGFEDNGDGTVTDTKSGLMWQKNRSNQGWTWHGAGKYCGGLSLGGHSDWRLPSKDELVSLWNHGGFHSTESVFYWSSETDPETAVFGYLAWIVSFKDGTVSHAPTSENNTDFLNEVRAVRLGN